MVGVGMELLFDQSLIAVDTIIDGAKDLDNR